LMLGKTIVQSVSDSFFARGLHSPYMVEPCIAGYPPYFRAFQLKFFID